MSSQKLGTKRVPMMALRNIPNTTAVPSDMRLSAPAPVANIMGITPKMNASAVIMMGRKRMTPALSAEVRIGVPDFRKSVAYSTMRMAFFADSPSSSINPIWVYMLMLSPMNIHPSTVPRIATGIESTTAMGSVQLSYCAARTSRVIIMANMNTTVMVVPDWVS